MPEARVVAGVSRGRHRGLLSSVLLGAACLWLLPQPAGASAVRAGRDGSRVIAGRHHRGSVRGRESGATGSQPDLATAAGYLAGPANLVDGSYYEPSPGFVDIGLTIDGALALAAVGTEPTAQAGMVGYVAANGAGWTGYGTSSASGSSLGKEALLAEVVGDDPRAFGGEDLIEALDATVCKAASAPSCVAPGNYAYSDSTYGQALGVMAQLRAADATGAASPIRYLESLQDNDGGWPALIPSGAGQRSDVDSTAMVVMALDLDPSASAAVQRGIAWIASQQESNGGFPGASGDSTNSTGLAVLALGLDAGVQGTRIRSALAFLATQQNADGGFSISSGPGSQPGSDLRSSTQAVSGAAGIPFGTLRSSTHPTPPPLTGSGAGGYRLVASDGGIFTFGDAGFAGSLGGKSLGQPVVGMAATPDGRGYWEVTATGQPFAFGDATFHGTKGRRPRADPVVGMAATPDGKGYWEVTTAGRVFTFGDARFLGSEGGHPLNRPVVGMAATPDGAGYWLVASDGGIFTFGDAGFEGSMGGTPLNRPVVGMAAAGGG